MFMFKNGTVIAAPPVSFLAYYLLNPQGEKITAFPAGFQMITGDPYQRNFTQPVPDLPPNEADNSQFSISQRSIGFNCLNYGLPPEGSLYRHFLPNADYLSKNCPDGLRLELLFPNCWNGKDLDSDDHKSHVAYAPGIMGTGPCPDGFPVRLPTLFYETIFAVSPFNEESGQFLLANGDPTGFGYHGDYMAGWEVPLLQNAINTCTNLSGKIEDCPLFNIRADYPQYSPPELQAAQEMQEHDCAGPRQGLCGNIQVQYGPGYAAPGIANQVVSSPTSSSSSSTSTTTSASFPSLPYSPGDHLPSYTTPVSTPSGIANDALALTTLTTTTTTMPPTTSSPPTNGDALYNGERITYYYGSQEVVEVITIATSTKYVDSVLSGDHMRRHLHAHQHRRHNYLH